MIIEPSHCYLIALRQREMFTIQIKILIAQRAGSQKCASPLAKLGQAPMAHTQIFSRRLDDDDPGLAKSPRQSTWKAWRR